MKKKWNEITSIPKDGTPVIVFAGGFSDAVHSIYGHWDNDSGAIVNSAGAKIKDVLGWMKVPF